MVLRTESMHMHMSCQMQTGDLGDHDITGITTTNATQNTCFTIAFQGFPLARVPEYLPEVLWVTNAGT